MVKLVNPPTLGISTLAVTKKEWEMAQKGQQYAYFLRFIEHLEEERKQEAK